MPIMRSIAIDDFRAMCRQREKDYAKNLADGGAVCLTCNGTGTHEGPRSTTLFGCRGCGGVGSNPPTN